MIFVGMYLRKPPMNFILDIRNNVTQSEVTECDMSIRQRVHAHS